MTDGKSLLDFYRKGPYRNIFVALIGLVLFDALAPNYAARGLFADLALAAIFTIALLESVRSRRNAVWAMVFGVPAIIARVAAAFLPDSNAVNTLILFITAVFTFFLIWNVLHDLAKEDRPTSERIYGALCAYIFVGFLFALVYAHIEHRRPGSFAVSDSLVGEASKEEAELLPVFTYYSFVTLTTLGYGDVTPVSEHARTLAWLEALLGQLYLAVMVAGFVAVHISERMKGSIGKPPPDG
jgi:hypothetical protein